MIQGNKWTRYFRMTVRYGLLWFLYGELPRHQGKGRASWARYFFTDETSAVSSHREGAYSVKDVVTRLRRERSLRWVTT